MTTAVGAIAAIGETPLVTLANMTGGRGRILAKAEFLQPGGSVKDRAARAIIEAARADGRLEPGGTVVEMTSGNMGAGLGVVCAALGHPLVVTMSRGNSPERATMMAALGAEVILVEQCTGVPGKVTGEDIAAAATHARQIAKERGAFYVDQFAAIEPIIAHEQTTGAELLRQAGIPIDGWVASIGTGATFLGVARAVRRANPDTICVAVEPEGSAVLAGEPVTRARHILQGTGYGIVPPHWDPALADRYMTVSDEAADRCRRDLATKEGLHVGYSAAANVVAALRLLSMLEGADPVVATVLCDTGLKYRTPIR